MANSKNKSSFDYLLPWVIFACIGAIYGIYSIQRHNIFHSNALDLAVFDQAIWKLSHFQAPIKTIGLNFNIFANHSHFILLLLVPLYWIWSNVQVLLIVQGLMVAIGIVPVFWLAKEKFKSNYIAICFSLAYLIFIGIQKALAFDFHEIVLALPLFLFAFWFWEKKRFVWYFVFLILFLITKEDLSLVVVSWGLWNLIFNREKKMAAITLAAGLAWFFLAFYVFMPYFAHGTKVLTWSQLYPLGTSFSSGIGQFFLHPIQGLKILVTPGEKVKVFIALFGSFAFLSFFAPRISFIMLPLFFEKFFSKFYGFYGIEFHYSAIFAPFLVIGAIQGLSNIHRYFPDTFKKFRVGKNEINYLIASAVLLASIVVSLNYHSPVFANLAKRSFWIEDENIRNDYRALAQIPNAVPVSAQNVFVPHLSHRDQIDLFPAGLDKADFIMLNPQDNGYPLDRAEIKKSIQELLANKNFHVKANFGTAVVFERKK